MAYGAKKSKGRLLSGAARGANPSAILGNQTPVRRAGT